MKIKALIINCTLKRSPATSNTEVLINKVIKEYEKIGVETESLRIVDYNIKPGVSSDEGEGDEWPEVFNKIKSCDIFILASPIWVGRTASTTQRIIERLDALFHEEDLMNKENGQFVSYNKVGGAIVTGNEDGAHSVTGHIIWAMQELGFTVPPNVNTYWVGKAGPGPSYIEAHGERHLYTNKTLRYLVHNTTYFAKLLKSNPIPTNLKKLSEEAKKESEEK